MLAGAIPAYLEDGSSSLCPALEPACPSVWSIIHLAPLSFASLSTRLELRPTYGMDPADTEQGLPVELVTRPCRLLNLELRENHAP